VTLTRSSARLPRFSRLLLLAAVALLALPAAAQARSADVVDAHVSLRLAGDASLLVTERLTFDYQGSFEGSYRDIVLRHGERITDVRVTQGGERYRAGGNTALGSHDEPSVFGVTSIANGARIVWHYRATDERRTYDVSYRVIDGAVAYDDVIDVFWAVWGNEWKFDLAHLGADLRNDALDPANSAYRVWGHPRSVEGTTARDPGIATLVADDVPDHTFVEFRVTVPRRRGQDVSGARRGAGKGLEKILVEEKELDEDFNSPWNKAKRWLANNSVALAMVLASLCLLVMIVLRVLGREHPVSTPQYLPEPPDDASPALAYGFAHEGGDTTDTVLATLLDLVERGYYETKQATTEDEKLDLAISKAEKRPAGELEPHEKEVLEFFDELLEGDSVPLSEMKDRIPEHSSTWRSRWTGMTGALDSIDAGKLRWDRNLIGWQVLLGFIVLALFAALSVIYVSVEEKFPLAAPIGLVTLLVVALSGGKKVKRLAPEYRERSSRWQAFERWTDDFPRLKDDPPATLDLWKRILIYGVAFGTADRMIKSGRIPAPVMEQSSSGNWTYYALSGQMAGSSFDGGSFSSGFVSQVAPESSGGGGGFSGGGGGGASGGGGGGSW
jgi:uncharacterized membrane protein